MGKIKLVGIDAGHGGSDPGAVGNGLREKDLTLSISKAIEKYLKDNFESVDVVQTRRDDRKLTLAQRTNILNKAKVDLVMSIHINSYKDPTSNGYESFISVSTKHGNTLKVIHDSVAGNFKNLGVRDRGLKRMNFYMVRHTIAPAILTESLFISNPKEAAILKKEVASIAKAHAEGAAKFLGLKRKTQSTQQSKPQVTSTIKVGDKVTVKKTATHYRTGQRMAEFVKGKTYTVTRVDKESALLSDIVSWVKFSDLTK